MTDDIETLLDELKALEHKIETKLLERRQTVAHHLRDGKIVFEKSVIAQHKRLKTGLSTFLRTSPVSFYLTAPVIYALIVPFAFLDLTVTLYQWICFPAWQITRVSRQRFIIFDRHHLAYLNVIQKFNCTYCAYANGVIAYVREVAARTEQFWCPIKHALRQRGTHDRYRKFTAFADAEGYVKRSPDLRRELENISPEC